MAAFHFKLLIFILLQPILNSSEEKQSGNVFNWKHTHVYIYIFIYIYTYTHNTYIHIIHIIHIYRERGRERGIINLNKMCHCVFFFHCRYWFALKYGYQAAFKQISSENQLIDKLSSIVHKTAIDAMADISMLRLFKTFLESTPQLILQIYVLMTSNNCAISQCKSAL